MSKQEGDIGMENNLCKCYEEYYNRFDVVGK